jgi:predicted flap endonuclease-1-like 5' DNA nuclease
MSALFRIVYATHANGTHHKLALDALNDMPRTDKKAWTRVFLKHVERYLEGSKAPDVSFKDFRNHVLHVSDNYWGGAPEKAAEWYRQTVAELRAGNWAEAAYAAGVLSHYYTDPVMPFHTGQTEAENAVHRATEWSINRTYNELRAIGEKRFASIDVPVPAGPNWLKEFVCHGAEFSHRYYEKLIAHYDIHKGATRPDEGLDDIAKGIVAELLMYAAKGYGRVLDAAITEAGVAAPDVALTAETFLAMTQIPRKFIEKRLTNAEDRKLVAAIYDELKTTGRVEHSLSEDDRTIRDLHRAEVLEPKLAKRNEARAERVASDAGSAKSMPPAIATAKYMTATADTTALELAVAKSSHIVSEVTQRPPALPDSSKAEADAATQDAVVRTPHPRPIPVRPADSARDEGKKYLFASDDLEAAPSIGPKMAERFAAAGVHTVGDFLGSDPHELAEQLDDAHFDAETLTDWQDQAQMVIDVPGLRGTHAQLLVGAGYRTAEAVAEADPVDLSGDVLKFAATSAGMRVLREGRPPDIEKIKSWVEYARHAVAA